MPHKWTCAFYGGDGPPKYVIALYDHMQAAEERWVYIYGGWNMLVKFEGRVKTSNLVPSKGGLT